MMTAVAVLENESFEQVADCALELDDEVRRKEVAKDKEPRPRRIFRNPKDELLANIRARTDLGDHPSYEGRKLLTVRFEQPGWAAAALCRVWQQYYLDHESLLGWMSRIGFVDDTVRALCMLIRRVPSRDPMLELERLAGKESVGSWLLVGHTVMTLIEDEILGKLARKTLDDWVESGRANKKCAAIFAYGFRFEQSDRVRTLAALARIGRSRSSRVHSTLMGMLFGLLYWSQHRGLVWLTVAAWADDRKSFRDDDGLRGVALDIAGNALRLFSDFAKLRYAPFSAELIEDFPKESRRLIRRIMEDRDYGPRALSTLDDLTYWQPMLGQDGRSKEKCAEFLRLMHLLAPDLRWWKRRRVVIRLCLAHPAHRIQIRRIFAVARKIERSGLRRGGESAQAQAVGDHEDAGAGHGDAGDHGVEEAGGGQG
jgi:hypothetical protein